MSLVACRMSEPTITPSSTAPTRAAAPSSTAPPPLTGRDEGLAAELAVLARLDALAGADRSKAERANLAWCERAHRRRSEALLAEAPETRPSAPTGSAAPSLPPLPTVASPTSGAAARKGADRALSRAVSGHRDRAIALSGAESLFWASLAAAATQSRVVVAAEDRVELPGEEPEHGPYQPLTEVAAAQALLTQVHAIVFGYQVALAPVPAQDGQSWVARLEQHRVVRDQVAELLRDRGASVPAAEPEYETGDAADSVGAARDLVARMESALLPFTGAWVAACRGADRRRAVGWLLTGARIAVSSGAAPRLWPGWPD